MAWNKNPSEGAKRLAIRTGCGSQFQLGSEKFVECLRKLPVQEIIDAAAEESFADFVWSPVVDGVFLPEPPTREYLPCQRRLLKTKLDQRVFPASVG